MLHITPLARLFFSRRVQTIATFSHSAETLQRQVLKKLLRQAAKTEYGERYHFDTLRHYEDFAQHVPLNDYESLKQSIERMRQGERDILWRGRIDWFAKSSGTTNDKSKFIPVSAQGLQQLHYCGGRDAVALYLHHHPESRMFAGKGLILGGSHQPSYDSATARVGDLSAILNEHVNAFVHHFRVPSKEIALLADFEEKRERIAQACIKSKVTNLSGVPSWMMSVLMRILEITGADNISQVWPDLEVFFHGGVAFTPYREQYQRLIPSPKMHYMETYNASEGFFALQTDPNDRALQFMLDYDVFFEFIPLEEVGREQPTILPIWQTEAGKNYALVISTSCGLWRYQIGDTVRFTQTHPHKFIISGRTKSFINAFGEELMVDNAEQGLKQACLATGAEVLEYTAAPVFMDAQGQCRHQWIIEFSRPPASLPNFAHALDEALQQINSDYEAKRHKDITLQRLEVVQAPTGLFTQWLKSKGKLGGQHKVPRLANERKHIEELLTMCANMGCYK